VANDKAEMQKMNCHIGHLLFPDGTSKISYGKQEIVEDVYGIVNNVIGRQRYL